MDEIWIDELIFKFREGVMNLVNKWNEIGIIGEKFSSRSKNLEGHVNRLLSTMLLEEENNMSKLLESIDILTIEIKELSAILGVDLEIVSEGTLFLKENYLLKQKYHLLTIKEDRVKNFHHLLNMEDELCQRLFEYTLNLDRNLIPTEKQLEEFQQRIVELDHLKNSRKLAFLNKRARIMELYNFLNKSSPVDSMIVTIFNDEEVLNVPLSKDFLNQCDRIIDNLQIKYQSNTNDCIKLRERLEVLQDILQPFLETSTHLPQLFNNSEDFSNETLDMLNNEVSRLEICRIEKLEEVIKSYQDKLRQKLKKNFSSHLESKENYSLLLNSIEITELLLENLETEFEKWCAFEKQLEPLRSEMETWDNLFHKITEIYKKLKDPLTLKNRGGILLKVEKDKKNVKLELSKTENKIRKILHSLDEQNFETFNLKIDHMEIRDYILHNWDRVESAKENERKDGIIKIQNSKLDLSSTKSTPFNQAILNKSDFKKPEIQKFPCKTLVKKNIPPNPKIKTNLDRRFSKSYNTLTINSSMFQLTGSNTNLYAIFCEDVKGTAITSSFVEKSSKKRK